MADGSPSENEFEMTNEIPGDRDRSSNEDEDVIWSMEEYSDEPSPGNSAESAGGSWNDYVEGGNQRILQSERLLMDYIRDLDGDELDVEDGDSDNEDDGNTFDFGENERIFSRFSFEVNVSSMRKEMTTNSKLDHLWDSGEPSTYKIPILYIEERVIFPGKEEKIRVNQPRFRNALFQSFTTCVTATHNSLPKTIGIVLVCNPPDGFICSVGVLAEVLKINNYFLSELPTDATIKTMNRFSIVQTYTANDGTPFADVRIIKAESEKSSSNIFSTINLPSISLRPPFFSPLAAVHTSRSKALINEYHSIDPFVSSLYTPTPSMSKQNGKRKLEEKSRNEFHERSCDIGCERKKRREMKEFRMYLKEEKRKKERSKMMKIKGLKNEFMQLSGENNVEEEDEEEEVDYDEEEAEKVEVTKEGKSLDLKDIEFFEDLLNDEFTHNGYSQLENYIDCETGIENISSNNCDYDFSDQYFNGKTAKIPKFNCLRDESTIYRIVSKNTDFEENCTNRNDSNEDCVMEETIKNERVALDEELECGGKSDDDDDGHGDEDDRYDWSNGDSYNSNDIADTLCSSYMYERRMMLKKSTWGNYSKLWKSEARRVRMHAELTSCPFWMYKMTNATLLKARVADMLEHLHRLPEDFMECYENPETFSFYIASKLPIPFLLKQQLLEKENSWIRLNEIIHIIQEMIILKCKFCKKDVARQIDQFHSGSLNSSHAYSNEDLPTPNCYHLCYGEGLRRNSLLNKEDSWYKGYASSAVFCKYCGCELGKHFLAIDSTVSPPSFWALMTSRVLTWHQNPLNKTL